MEETVTIPLQEYEELQQIKEKHSALKQNYDRLLDQFRLAQIHRFCSSSEKNKTNQEPPEQLRLEQVFNETEATADEITVKAHKLKKYVTNLDNLPENVGIEVINKDIRNGSIEMQSVAFFDKLFAYEESISNMTPDERKAKRLEFSKTVLDELNSFAQNANVPQNRQIGKAFQYLFDQWKWLTVWLEDERLEISNNRAERSIKPFVMGRKNFLFCNTPRGAHSSAVIYSMVETAKENALDPFLYLTWGLKTAHYLNLRSTANIDKLLPENAPSDCYSRKKINVPYLTITIH